MKNSLYYRGKCVDDMTKDELVNALTNLANLYQQVLQDKRRQLVIVND